MYSISIVDRFPYHIEIVFLNLKRPDELGQYISHPKYSTKNTNCIENRLTLHQLHGTILRLNKMNTFMQTLLQNVNGALS